jgi:hypothetical protein
LSGIKVTDILSHWLLASQNYDRVFPLPLGMWQMGSHDTYLVCLKFLADSIILFSAESSFNELNLTVTSLLQLEWGYFQLYWLAVSLEW